MTIHRRDALKGLSLGAGSLVFSQILSRLEARAAGTATLPKRFVFVVESNGVRPEQISPGGLKRDSRQERPGAPGEYVDVSLADRDLQFSLEPLKPWKDKLKTGRYVDYPGYGGKGHRTTANMYVTLLQLAGSQRASFGMADPNLKGLDQHGPLEELLG